MSVISPKVIDVDGNRIGSYVEKRGPTINTNCLVSLQGSKIIRGDNKTGRFPTQLFTNYTIDKYKFVRTII